MNNIFAQLPDALLPWYEKNKRDLPWRTDNDPYHVWVSEIMLQQTRVEAVTGYYARFLTALPRVESLACADDALLYKLWEGLGYYNRVRNMKKAAIQIMERFNGIFPREYEDVLSLPGIGEYTAGAICSIAFGMPMPAVDGNVLRVISRLTNDNTPIDRPDYKKSVQKNLASVYPTQAGAFTQALMELGATICGPNKKPTCEFCPCAAFCRAAKNKTAELLPVKLPKRSRRNEEKTVFIFSCDGDYALEKRSDKGLLAGLWQFPNVGGKLSLEDSLKTVQSMGLSVIDILRQVDRNHIFTHIEWDMRGCYFEVRDKAPQYHWLSKAQINEETALPTAFRQFWEEIDNV